MGQIEQMVAELLIEDGLTPWKVPMIVAKAFPETEALVFSFAFTCVASGVEMAMENGSTIDLPDAAELYRIAALLAVDILLTDSTSNSPSAGTNLLTTWSESSESIFYVN